MIEQTAEQKAETMADTLIERLDKMPSMIPVDEVRETILDAIGLVELVKCKERCEALEKDRARLDWLEIKRIKDEQIERNVIFLKSGGTLRTAIDNAREGKPTSVPEHSPENRTTDP